MRPEETYEIVRNLTTPVVALTSTWNGRHNGMIADSAMRASLSLRVPRVSVFIQKWNLSHDMILRTGRLVLHLLHREQWDLIWRLGFFSGRDAEKLKEIPHRLGVLGRPILDDCYAYLECSVVNLMDAGGSTCFLADVVGAGGGTGDDVMTAAYLRANMPESWRPVYLERLKRAQEFADEHARPLVPRTWQGPEPEGSGPET